MDGPYKFKNLENQGINVGTDSEPYFYEISAGQKDRQSLLFYAQIEQFYYMYRINQVNRKTLNLHCRDRSCPARAQAYLSPETGLILENGTRSNGSRLKRQYKVDFSNLQLRELKNYTFLPTNSQPHKPGCTGLCRHGILEHSIVQFFKAQKVVH